MRSTVELFSILFSLIHLATVAGETPSKSDA